MQIESKNSSIKWILVLMGISVALAGVGTDVAAAAGLYVTDNGVYYDPSSGLIVIQSMYDANGVFAPGAGVLYNPYNGWRYDPNTGIWINPVNGLIFLCNLVDNSKIWYFLNPVDNQWTKLPDTFDPLQQEQQVLLMQEIQNQQQQMILEQYQDIQQQQGQGSNSQNNIFSPPNNRIDMWNINTWPEDMKEEIRVASDPNLAANKVFNQVLQGEKNILASTGFSYSNPGMSISNSGMNQGFAVQDRAASGWYKNSINVANDNAISERLNLIWQGCGSYNYGGNSCGN